MRTPALLATLLLSALLAQTAVAVGGTVRDDNRQALIAQEQGAYDPTAMVRVVIGQASGMTSTTVTAADALEMQLDFLEARGIALDPPSAQATATPQWPLFGQLEFHERGWVDTVEPNASCPVVTPDTGVIRDLLRGNTNSDLGLYTSDISEYWRNSQGFEATSTLKHTADPTQPATTYRYGGLIDEGWTVQAGVLIQDSGDSQFFCKEPASGFGQVQLDAVVTPVADRTDD